MLADRTCPSLAIVVPCYNEQSALPHSAGRLLETLDALIAGNLVSTNSGIYFVDDGSSDGTWPAIVTLATTSHRVHGIKLSRNYGHQSALLAGLLTVTSDAVITIDADLQDDVSAIREMVQLYRGGAEIVYGVRQQRESDSWLKRVSAEGYYTVAAALGVRLIYNHADYRLLGRRALDALATYPERNLFLRGIIPQLGFSSAVVHYPRLRRVAGESKYPLRKMMAFAFDGITSFSAVPLKIITLVGLAVALLSVLVSVWAVWVKLSNPAAVPGWTSILLPLSLLAGAQLLSTGIIGQYLAKIYLETKARPRFTIDETTQARTIQSVHTATSDQTGEPD